MTTNVFGSNVEGVPRFFDWQSAGTEMCEYISNYPYEFESMTTHKGEPLPLADKALVMKRLLESSDERPLPPGCIEQDFTGASDESLVKFLKSIAPSAFMFNLIEEITLHGCTHNQRALISKAARLAVEL